MASLLMSGPGRLTALLLLFASTSCSGNDTSAGASAGGNGGSAGSSMQGGASGSSAGTTGSGGSSSGAGGRGGTSAGGTNAGGTNAGGTNAGGTNAGSYIACADPSPVMVGGQETGFVRCEASDVLHRVSVVDCPNLLPRDGAACTPIGPGESTCTSDADCTGAPLGICTTVPTSHYPGCGCVYGCERDSDCAQGELCECADPIGRCRPASCASDAACAPGSLCASADMGWGGCTAQPPARGYECQAQADTCLTDAQCAAPLPACAFEAGARSCHQGQLQCP